MVGPDFNNCKRHQSLVDLVVDIDPMVSYGILLKQIVDGGCTKTIHNNLP
jgi:hypothetical protein